MSETMKAVRVHEQGGPEKLVYETLPVPVPERGEVLVRVHAAGMNPPDWYARSGFTKIPEDLRPRVQLPFVPGTDVSGVVAAAGSGATRFAEGEEVYGLVRFPRVDRGGSCYAEYVTVPEEHLALKPASVDHVQAAGVPMAGLTAYQYVFDLLRMEKGRTVMVNGAAGGVGHFLVQLAKTLDAHVIAVASTRHEDFLRDLGADRYVDYTTTRPEEVIRGVDVAFDCVAGPEGHRFLQVVNRGGFVCPVFLGEYHPERAAELGITVAMTQVHSDGAQMAELARLIDAGAVRVGVDEVFPLAEAARAHERAERGHIQGKLVLKVRD